MSKISEEMTINPISELFSKPRAPSISPGQSRTRTQDCCYKCRVACSDTTTLISFVAVRCMHVADINSVHICRARFLVQETQYYPLLLIMQEIHAAGLYIYLLSPHIYILYIFLSVSYLHVTQSHMVV